MLCVAFWCLPGARVRVCVCVCLQAVLAEQELEEEVRQQLKRQSVAHMEHLGSALEAQAERMERHWHDQLQEEVDEHAEQHLESLENLAASIKVSSVYLSVFVFLSCNNLLSTFPLACASIFVYLLHLFFSFFSFLVVFHFNIFHFLWLL